MSVTAQPVPNGARSVVDASAWSAFLAGACAPSAAALFLAALICAGWIVACARLVTPRWVVRHESLLTTGRRDEFPQLASRALGLRLSHPREPLVVLIGDSSLREAVTSEADLSRRLGERAGRPTSAALLAAGGVTILDELALTDQILAGRPRGVVVLEVSQYDLCLDPINVRRSPGDATHDFPFESPSRRDELRQMGVPVGPLTHNLFLDGRRFFASRVDRLVSLRHDRYLVRQHLFEGRGGWTERDWHAREAAEKVCRWEAGYRRNRDANFAIYARLLARLRSAGLHPCLLRMVENPRNAQVCGPPGAPLRGEYQADLRAFAATQGVPLLDDLERAAGLDPADFGDYVHLRADAARQRYTAALADRLAPVVAGATAANRPIATTAPSDRGPQHVHARPAKRRQA